MLAGRAAAEVSPHHQDSCPEIVRLVERVVALTFCILCFRAADERVDFFRIEREGRFFFPGWRLVLAFRLRGASFSAASNFFCARRLR